MSGFPRTLVVSRRARLAVALVMQAALVAVAVAGQLSARLTGQEVVLEVAPVDPIDPFRGAYVALDYPGLATNEQLSQRPGSGGETVYVPLRRIGDLWVGGTPLDERPESRPFLRCHDEHWRLRCGIESWFLPQDDAYALEQAVREGRALARIRVDSRGHAALVAVEVP